MWAAAAARPRSEAPTFSTATPTPSSAHTASASRSRSPSPSDSTSSAIDWTSGSRARCSTQSGVVTTASLPLEIAVWSRSPRRVASALTTRLPLCDTSATCPGCGAASASPHSAARECSAISPSQLGPQTGSACRSAASLKARSSDAPGGGLPEARAVDDRAAAPSAPASSMTAGTPAAGIATTTASGAEGRSDSDGTQAKPCTDDRRGLTPQTSPLIAEPPQVEQRLRGVRLGALAGAHDRDGAKG